MKKRIFSILLSLCMVLALFPVTAFAEENHTIKIDGPDVVCAQQDYEFTVTPPEGVTLDKEFGYDTGMKGSGADLTIDENGVGHGVMSKEWYDRATNCFDVIAHGTTADGTPVSTTKHVEVSPEHIYVDGVCVCGAVLTYIVEYDGGAEFGLQVDVKTYGEDLTLRCEAFHRDGYVQTGWMGSDGVFYELGGIYSTDADVTMYAVWDKLLTLTVPFTTTVTLGDAGVPGETTFDLEIVGTNAGDADISDVTVSGSVTTNGAGDYEGTMTFTGPSEQIWHMFCEGAVVKQVDAGEEGWTYDDTAWGLLLWENLVEYAMSDDDMAEPEYIMLIVPTVCEETDDGVYYDIDWDAIDWDDDDWADQLPKEMSFTNIYTASTHTHDYTLKYDETSHWNECGCGDVQNKEAHKYGEWVVTKDATETEVGEKVHTCTVCGYQEKAEIAKLTKPGTVDTGDNSNFALWFALLAVSAAGVIGTGVYSKRRRSSRAK